MEQRLANTWQMTVNEKKFIEAALILNLRTDGRHLHDYRELSIDFGWNDGSSEVQLGQTRVVGLVTAQLAQPYADRPNEGNLFIYTEFSPMADASFEAGRPGELAIELGRIIDRGLRESRAVDTESLCVVPGKTVWSLRLDLQILDNGGNLIDAANIAALAALLTFRRPNCSVGGSDGLEVMVHPPEVSEPIPLIVHYLPITVTFAFFSKLGVMVVDPNHFEEAEMDGRMTITANVNGDVCAIQKPGGVGIAQSVITECLEISLTKAAELTDIIENAVELYKSGRELGKLKLNHPDASLDDSLHVSEGAKASYKVVGSGFHIELLTLPVSCNTRSNHPEVQTTLPEQEAVTRNCKAKDIIKGHVRWDPYPKGADPDHLKVSLAAQSQGKNGEKLNKPSRNGQINSVHKGSFGERYELPSLAEISKVDLHTKTNLSLKDAVKPKDRRKITAPSSATTT